MNPQANRSLSGNVGKRGDVREMANKKKMTLADLVSLVLAEESQPEQPQQPQPTFPKVGDEGWVVRSKGWETIRQTGEKAIQHEVLEVKFAGVLKSNGWDSQLRQMVYWDRLGKIATYVAHFQSKEAAEEWLKSYTPKEREVYCPQPDMFGSNGFGRWNTNR